MIANHGVDVTLSILLRGLAIASLASGLAACSAASDTEKATTPVRQVSTIKATIGESVRRGSLSGEVKAQVQQNLSFRTGGRVAEVLVDTGDHVTAGQVLARIDDADQQASLDVAQAAVRTAEAQRDQAQSSFERADALFKAGNTTRAQFESAETALTQAKSALDAAQSQADTAAELVSYAELKALSDGIVVTRAIEPSQVVAAGQTVFALAQDGPRDAVFNISETAIAGVPEDAPVTLQLVADPTITATGTLREISPTIDTATGTVRAKVIFEDPNNAMPLGAAVMGIVDFPAESGVSLPWTALFRDSAGPAVWVMDAATSTVALKPVTVVRYLADTVLVTDGLAEGDAVVTSGLQLLHPGERVAATEVTP